MYHICVYAFITLYGIGCYTIDTIKSTYDGSSLQSDCLSVNISNNTTKPAIIASIKSFFQSLIENEGEDYASRQVRRNLGHSYLRDDELDGVRLPPHYSKKLVYERWCYEQGWIVGRGGHQKGSYKQFQS